MPDPQRSEAMLRLTAADGFVFDAFKAAAPGDRRGGLVILQEIFGLTDQLKSVARFFAGNGFDAIVPSLMDRAAPGTVVPFGQPDRARELMLGIAADKMALDIAAAVRAVEGRGVDGGKMADVCQVSRLRKSQPISTPKNKIALVTQTA